MNRHTSDAAVESSHLTGVRRRVSSGSSSSSFDKDPRLRQRRRPSKAVLPQHHGWNRSRVGRHSQVCLFKCHARCDVSTPCFDITTLIRFCQTHLLTFFCSSFARCARQQRIWDIQNRRHIRAPQREEVTDDGTDYEVHFVKARYAIRDVDAMRRLSLSLSLSLSLARFFFCTPRAPPPPSRSVVVVSFLFALFFFSLSLFPRGVIGLVYHY